MPTPKKTSELFKRYHSERAKETPSKKLLSLIEGQIVTENEPLIMKIVKRFRAQWDLGHLPIEDSLQAGRTGCLLAVRIYDPTRASFSTCAGLWILQRLQAWAVSEGYNVKARAVPAEVFHRLRKFRVLEGREPTAEELGVTQKIWDIIYIPQTFHVGLDSLGKGEDYDEDDNVEAPQQADPETILSLAQIVEALPANLVPVFETRFIMGATPNEACRELGIKKTELEALESDIRKHFLQSE